VLSYLPLGGGFGNSFGATLLFLAAAPGVEVIDVRMDNDSRSSAKCGCTSRILLFCRLRHGSLTMQAVIIHFLMRERAMVSRTKGLSDKRRLIVHYEWLRRTMRLLDLLVERVDRQLVEVEKLLPDDYEHPDDATQASGLTRRRKTAQ
jgi:hypothetical protein